MDEKNEIFINDVKYQLADLLNADVQQNKGYTKYLDDTIDVPTPSVPTRRSRNQPCRPVRRRSRRRR